MSAAGCGCLDRIGENDAPGAVRIGLNDQIGIVAVAGFEGSRNSPRNTPTDRQGRAEIGAFEACCAGKSRERSDYLRKNRLRAIDSPLLAIKLTLDFSVIVQKLKGRFPVVLDDQPQASFSTAVAER
jgi:hypothetical protein